MSIPKNRITITECSICMEHIKQEHRSQPSMPDLLPDLTCGHEYHLACLKQWEDEKLHDNEPTECPMCRVPFDGIIHPLDPLICSVCEKVLTSERTFYMQNCGHLVCDGNDHFHEGVRTSKECNLCGEYFNELEHSEGAIVRLADSEQPATPPRENEAAAGRDGAAPAENSVPEGMISDHNGEVNNDDMVIVETLRAWVLVEYPQIADNDAANPQAPVDDGTGAGHGQPLANSQVPVDDGTGAGHESPPANPHINDGTEAGHETDGIRRPVYDQETEWSLRGNNAWERAGQRSAVAESNGAAGGYSAPDPVRPEVAMSPNLASEGGAAAESNGAAGGYSAPDPVRRNNARSLNSEGMRIKRLWSEMANGVICVHSDSGSDQDD